MSEKPALRLDADNTKRLGNSTQQFDTASASRAMNSLPSQSSTSSAPAPPPSSSSTPPLTNIADRSAHSAQQPWTASRPANLDNLELRTKEAKRELESIRQDIRLEELTLRDVRCEAEDYRLRMEAARADWEEYRARVDAEWRILGDLEIRVRQAREYLRYEDKERPIREARRRDEWDEYYRRAASPRRRGRYDEEDLGW